MILNFLVAWDWIDVERVFAEINYEHLKKNYPIATLIIHEVLNTTLQMP